MMMSFGPCSGDISAGRPLAAQSEWPVPLRRFERRHAARRLSWRASCLGWWRARPRVGQGPPPALPCGRRILDSLSAHRCRSRAASPRPAAPGRVCAAPWGPRPSEGVSSPTRFPRRRLREAPLGQRRCLDLRWRGGSASAACHLRWWARDSPWPQRVWHPRSRLQGIPALHPRQLACRRRGASAGVPLRWPSFPRHLCCARRPRHAGDRCGRFWCGKSCGRPCQLPHRENPDPRGMKPA
jgi:hypothetical protein